MSSQDPSPAPAAVAAPARACHTVFILDRSGSMAESGKAVETINGFNQLIEAQRAVPGECAVTLVQFDHVIETLHDNIPLAEVPTLTDKVYFPRGQTCLFDAIGRTIDLVAAHWEKIPEADRPRVLVTIMTDGLENSSHAFSCDKVKEMIAARRAMGWEFVFFGTSEAAIDQARDINISMTVQVGNSAGGTADAYRSSSSITEHFRGGRPSQN